MILDKDIALLFMSLGLIAISPLIAILSSRISKYLLDKYVADEILIITYTTNGVIDSRVTIKTKTDGSTAAKIKRYGESTNE